jgi:hypothetical protein
MNKKIITALLLIISLLVLGACSKKTQESAPALDSTAQESESGSDLGSDLDDASTLGDDLNVEDTSETDAALTEIQNI